MGRFRRKELSVLRQGLEEAEVRSWQPEQPLFLPGFTLAGEYYVNWVSVGLQVAENQLWLIGK